MNKFLYRQGEFILQKESFAFCLVALFALLPFTAWISLSIVALVVLRKGLTGSINVLLVGLAAAIANTYIHFVLSDAIQVILLTYIATYLAANLLRTSASWQTTVDGVLVFTLLILVLVQWFAPQYINQQFHTFVKTLSAVTPNDLITNILKNKNALQSTLFANYLLGIKALCAVMTVLMSLLFARYIQSILFYPEGFKKELLCFKASKWVVVLTVISLIGARSDNVLAISGLPLLLAILVTGGMILILNVLKKNGLSAVIILLVPLVIVPYVMLPVYVIMGSLDSLLNIRMRLSTTGKSKNRGE